MSWEDTPEGTLEFWESLTFKQQAALHWATQRERKLTEARVQEIIEYMKEANRE